VLRVTDPTTLVRTGRLGNGKPRDAIVRRPGPHPGPGPVAVTAQATASFWQDSGSAVRHPALGSVRHGFDRRTSGSPPRVHALGAARRGRDHRGAGRVAPAHVRSCQDAGEEGQRDQLRPAADARVAALRQRPFGPRPARLPVRLPGPRSLRHRGGPPDQRPLPVAARAVSREQLRRHLRQREPHAARAVPTDARQTSRDLRGQRLPVARRERRVRGRRRPGAAAGGQGPGKVR